MMAFSEELLISQRTPYLREAVSYLMGSGGYVVERRTLNRGDSGSIPPTAVSKLRLRQFRSSHICLCLSEVTLKAGGPFCLVPMPGEEKDPTQGVNV